MTTTKPTIALGNLNGVAMAAGDVIQVLDTDGTTVVGSYTVKASDLTSGAWSAGPKDITLSVPLTEGAHDLRVRLSDAAGNTGTTSSGAASLTVDTLAPSSLSTLSLQLASSGNPGTGSTVGTTKPTIALGNLNGLAMAAGDVIQLLDTDGTTVVGSYTVRASDLTAGVWSAGPKDITLSVALSQGAHDLRVRLSDAAGNAGAASSSAASVLRPPRMFGRPAAATARAS